MTTLLDYNAVVMSISTIVKTYWVILTRDLSLLLMQEPSVHELHVRVCIYLMSLYPLVFLILVKTFYLIMVEDPLPDNGAEFGGCSQLFWVVMAN